MSIVIVFFLKQGKQFLSKELLQNIDQVHNSSLITLLSIYLLILFICLVHIESNQCIYTVNLEHKSIAKIFLNISTIDIDKLDP